MNIQTLEQIHTTMKTDCISWKTTYEESVEACQKAQKDLDAQEFGTAEYEAAQSRVEILKDKREFARCQFNAALDALDAFESQDW